MFLGSYFETFYGRTFIGSMHVRPEVLCTYVLGTYGRTSTECMNDGEQTLNERHMNRLYHERFLNDNEPT